MATQVALESNSTTRTSTAIYALAIFLSAFLLFAVEPLIAKMIVPWFGGSASVWTICLLFFQTALLAGYAYAHLLTRMPKAKQAWVHVAVIAASLASLPIIPNVAWKPNGIVQPEWRILLVLAVTIGVPFFVLSSTGPLLQAWWSRTPHPSQNQARVGHPQNGADVGHLQTSNPYRFYALSNAGSMLALLSYPILIEPYVHTRMQAMVWSGAYVIAGVLCGWIALRARGTAGRVELAEVAAHPPSRMLRLLWVSLAAVASALLLAITNHISQNIAAVPFLWVLPLSLYLLSFIVCFDHPRWYRRSVFLRLVAVALGGLAYVLSDKFDPAPLVVLVPMFCGFLFVCCMFCHGELARLKPHPRYLTSFYLMIALGGALGALFVALIAPRVFTGLTELPIAVGACAVLAVIVVARDPDGIFQSHPSQKRARVGHPVILLMSAIALAIVVSLAVNAREDNEFTRFKGRNFYGILRVYDKLSSMPPQIPPNPADIFDPPDPRYRELVNGTINHGLQFLTPSMRRFATTYYSTNSGVGVALVQEGKRGPLRVGVIGLGAGTLASYGRWGDKYRFYDINPLVIDVAQHQFTFLKDSQAQVDIVPGDARLSLEREPKQNFDVLAVDAFSGDSIPVHLLTLESFELYFKHLRPGGVLAVHVSNRYLDLVPVVRGAAARLGMKVVVMENAPDDDHEVFDSTWVLVSDHELPYKEELFRAGEVTVAQGRQVLWTDDYSSVWSLLKSRGTGD
ncbi:MAG: fused MFS/spermidine synthase [Terriglobales bacterium]